MIGEDKPVKMNPPGQQIKVPGSTVQENAALSAGREREPVPVPEPDPEPDDEPESKPDKRKGRAHA